MSFELNLAHISISDLLEKAAEKNELIFVRQGQRRLGKTTSLIEFARKNNCPVLTRKEMARCYQLEHPDLNIIGYVDGSEVDGLHNVVFDEGVPRAAVKRLYELGILLTGFVRVNDHVDINEDERCSVIGGYSMEAPSKKNPLGVKPRFIHDEQRAEELSGAIMRYIQANRRIPTEWLEEYNELLKKIML